MEEEDGRIEDDDEPEENEDQNQGHQNSNAYMNEGGDELVPLSLCLESTITQITVNFILPILVANVMLRVMLSLLKRRKVSPAVHHGSMTVVGLLLLCFHFRGSLEVLFSLLLFSILCVILFSFDNRTAVTWTAGLLCLGVNEYAINILNYRTLMRGRMQLMMTIMKLVSVSGSPLSLSKVTCYLLHPASVVQGVWFPITLVFDDKKNHRPFTLPGKYFKGLKQMTSSLLFLVSSNCTIEFLVKSYLEPLIAFNFYNFLPESIATFLHLVFVYYFVALQFRFSHYFMAASAEALFAIHGLEYPVSHPWKVEFPRSLVDVVIYWNIPMHQWIKQHVFLPLSKVTASHQKLPLFVVILGTYAASSLLHGLHVQIWSVLLTLGFLTFIEFKLRSRLSNILSGCVLAKACRASQEGPTTCNLGHKETSSFLIKVVNGFFVILSILHLIFLGSAFDGSETSSYTQVYETWSILSFFSPVIGVVSFIIYLFLLCISPETR
jgi:porcupine-like protein